MILDGDNSDLKYRTLEWLETEAEFLGELQKRLQVRLDAIKARIAEVVKEPHGNSGP